MTRLTTFLAFAFVTRGALAAPAEATFGVRPPEAAREADIEEHLGRPLDPELALTDMDGRIVRLGDLFDGRRPVLLVLAYYRCPMLCGLVLKGVATGLSKLEWQLGDQYRALTVSFDPRDTPQAAAKKQASTLAAMDLGAGTRAGWPFLVTRADAARALADGLGFRYAYDPDTDQYAHPAAAFVLTPDGRISRYLYGAEFSARDLRLALLEASSGRTGTLADRVLMTCYRYDPATRRYGAFLVGFIRLGALAILAVVSAVLATLWVGERRRRREEVAR